MTVEALMLVVGVLYAVAYRAIPYPMGAGR
jgi:hypothetical protein